MHERKKALHEVHFDSPLDYQNSKEVRIIIRVIECQAIAEMIRLSIKNLNPACTMQLNGISKQTSLNR